VSERERRKDRTGVGVGFMAGMLASVILVFRSEVGIQNLNS